MKSERAKQHIEETSMPMFTTSDVRMLYQTAAESAVNLAEADARERAVKAYCATCGSFEQQKRCGYRTENHTPCRFINERYLYAYDHANQ